MKLILSDFKDRQKVRINYEKQERFVVVYYVADGLVATIQKAVDIAFDKQLQKDIGTCDIMSITVGEN